MQSQILCLRLMHVKAAFSSPYCCQTSHLLSLKISLERKKFFNQEKVQLPSCGTAVLSGSDLISVMHSSAPPYPPRHFAVTQSCLFLCSSLTLLWRCLVGTGACSSVFQQDSHQTWLSGADKLPPLCNTQSCNVSHEPADLCCTSLPALPVLLLC